MPRSDRPMISSSPCHSRLFLVLAVLAWTPAPAAQRQETFDQEPRWDGFTNRSARPETIRQDFGWSPGATRVGGRIQPAAEPAYYAKGVPTRTLRDAFSASGTVLVESGGGHTLIGFFDSRTLNEWRTPNSIALRIQQR